MVGRVSDAGSSPVAQIILGLWCSGIMVGLDPTDLGSIPGNPFHKIYCSNEQYISLLNRMTIMSLTQQLLLQTF